MRRIVNQKKEILVIPKGYKIPKIKKIPCMCYLDKETAEIIRILGDGRFSVGIDAILETFRAEITKSAQKAIATRKGY